MKTVMVISFSDLANDPRVNRQLQWLAGRFRVIAVGTADPMIDGVTFRACTPRRRHLLKKVTDTVNLLVGRFERYYWDTLHIAAALAQLADVQADVIVANDIEALPLALRLAKGARVVYDAHEYSPREFEELWRWRLLIQRYNTYLCRRYLPQASAMMTVCTGIAEAYAENFGVKPEVVTNAPDYAAREPRPTDPSRIRMIHHGVATPSRKLENMIKMMDQLDARFELDLMLVSGGNPAYLDSLKALSRNNPRVRFLDPVPMRRIVETIAQYDVGVYLLEPTNFNNEMALPNKFFEFIQARLAVVIGPSPEMARLVREHGFGLVAEDFRPDSLVSCLKGLDAEQIDRFKERAHRIARTLSSEANAATVLRLVERLED